MIFFAVLNWLVSDVKRIFACKVYSMIDDFSGFVDIGETGKHNRVGALVLGNGRIRMFKYPCMLYKLFFLTRELSKHKRYNFESYRIWKLELWYSSLDFYRIHFSFTSYPPKKISASKWSIVYRTKWWSQGLNIDEGNLPQNFTPTRIPPPQKKEQNNRKQENVVFEVWIIY